MDKNFSTFLKGKQETLKKIVSNLSEHFEYVSILASDCQGQEITVSEKQVSVKDSSYNERGFVVRTLPIGCQRLPHQDQNSRVEQSRGGAFGPRGRGGGKAQSRRGGSQTQN